MSEPFKVLTSKTLTLSQANIDTDQIIPARFLTTTSREGLGAHAFHDWRYEADGSAKPEAVPNSASFWPAPTSPAARRANTPPGPCWTMASGR